MAADAVLLSGWNRPVPGREKMAVELLGESIAFWAAKQQQGKIASFAPYFLQAHGGDLNGFILVHGDPNQLAAIQQSDEFLDLTTRTIQNVEGFGIIGGWTGESLMKLTQLYSKYAK